MEKIFENDLLKHLMLFIQFISEWSREEINFLDFNERQRNRQIETNLYIKPS